MANWPSTTLQTPTTHDVTAHATATCKYVSAKNPSDPATVGDMPAVAVAPYALAPTAGMSTQAHRQARVCAVGNRRYAGAGFSSGRRTRMCCWRFGQYKPNVRTESVCCEPESRQQRQMFACASVSSKSNCSALSAEGPVYLFVGQGSCLPLWRCASCSECEPQSPVGGHFGTR